MFASLIVDAFAGLGCMVFFLALAGAGLTILAVKAGAVNDQIRPYLEKLKTPPQE